jgi:hypothetical protein
MHRILIVHGVPVDVFYPAGTGDEPGRYKNTTITGKII